MARFRVLCQYVKLKQTPDRSIDAKTVASQAQDSPRQPKSAPETNITRRVTESIVEKRRLQEVALLIRCLQKTSACYCMRAILVPSMHAVLVTSLLQFQLEGFAPQILVS